MTTHTSLKTRTSALPAQWAFRPPAGTDSLRARCKARPRLTREGIETAVSALRSGADLDTCTAAAGADKESTRDLISRIGASIGQAQKQHGKTITRVLESRRAPRLGLQPGQSRLEDGGYVVAAAPGWAGGGRDIRRAYAQVLLAEPEWLAEAISKSLTQLEDPEPTEQHYRDCWMVDRMTFDAQTVSQYHLSSSHCFTLEDLPASDQAARVYVQAVDRLEHVMATSVKAARLLVRACQGGHVSAQDVLRAQNAWWLLTGYPRARRSALAHLDGDPQALLWVRAWGRRIAHHGAHQPRTLYPSELRELTRVQMNAVIAQASRP